jgi:hypothetical protein
MLVSFNWPVLIFSIIILGAIIGFFVYFFRLLIKAIKIYINNNQKA